jgi:hypothetical protein
MTGRTVEELHGWAEMLELCEEDCLVIKTTQAMRTGVVAVEKELHRLHRVEALAIRLAALLERIRVTSTDDGAWEDAMNDLWEMEEGVVRDISALVPGALAHDNLDAAIRRPIETLVPRSLS